MSERAVPWAIGKLTLDEKFRARFSANPAAAVWEAGLPLSPVEVDAFTAVPTRAIGEPARSSGEVRSRRGAREARGSGSRCGA